MKTKVYAKYPLNILVGWISYIAVIAILFHVGVPKEILRDIVRLGIICLITWSFWKTCKEILYREYGVDSHNL